MEQVKLNEVYKKVRELMTEYGIEDNTLFVYGAIKSFNHKNSFGIY